MENYQGDLTDIFRALPQSTDASNWEFQSDPNPILSNLPSSSSPSCDANLFGDPFVHMRDPLLHQLNGSCYLNSPAADETAAVSCNSNNNLQKAVDDTSPVNIFSRIQISHSNNHNNNNPITEAPLVGSSQSFSKASSMVSIDMGSTDKSKGCFIDSTSALQISSPRNLGIKRRKSQAKKVVCIPAPAVANSRPSGEVVPSDLWAWRKYGQKPIKGSPYPRGYYRCSSSKGCSARKQVERSRTDPNMLVITYTSEHNHPWPTQRNALAGSTRSQPPKSTTTTAATSKTKEELKESKSNDTLSPDPTAPSASIAPIKQETNEMESNTPSQFNSYRPTLPDSNQSDDFFADLGEIEADPIESLEAFTTLFDWSSDQNNTSIGQGKKGL